MFDCGVPYNCNQRQLCGVKVTQVQKDKRGWASVCSRILVHDIVLQSFIDLHNGHGLFDVKAKNYKTYPFIQKFYKKNYFNDLLILRFIKFNIKCNHNSAKLDIK